MCSHKTKYVNISSHLIVLSLLISNPSIPIYTYNTPSSLPDPSSPYATFPNTPSFSSIYLTKSSIVQTLIPHFLPNSKHSSLLIIPPF